MTPESISRSTWTLLVASAFPGIGKNTLWQIAADPFLVKSDAEALSELHPALEHFKSRSTRFLNAESKALRQLELCEKHNARLIGYWDKDYPAYFRNAPSSPAIFWHKGSIDAIRMPLAAVIGTREPTHDGRISAERITAALSERGIGIVSGLALGIDTIAHQTCTRAKRPTVAILPCGIDTIAPKQNVLLADEILSLNGAIVSEFPIGSPAFSSNFVTRDSTQAALSSAVVLVQTGTSGGSLHASRAILKLKRRLIVVQPTERDRLYGEPKAKGNLGITQGDEAMLDKIGAIKSASHLIYHLASREQYDEIKEIIQSHFDSMHAKASIPNTGER